MRVTTAVARERARPLYLEDLDIEGDSVPEIYLYAQGRFTFDRLFRYYSLEQKNQAAEKGEVSKPVLRKE